MTLKNVEVLELILLQLDARSFFYARQVCKLWRDITHKPGILWQHISQDLLTHGDSDTEPLETQIFKDTLEKVGGGGDAKPDRLSEIYLDIVRYSMVVYDISILKSLSIGKKAENETRVLARDGSILLTVTQQKDGTVDLNLFNLLTESSECYRHENRRPIELVQLSSDNLFVALSSSYGYLEVLKLCKTKCEIIYSRQYPSHFESIAVSRGGDVFMGKSIRLGGYSVVNLDTAEEIDIGHYRLDLSLQSLFDDLVLILPGRGETFIYGWPLSGEQTIPRERGQLWRYYKYLIRNDIFYYITRAKAIPLPFHKGYFLTVLRDEDEDSYQLALCHEEYNKPPGFRTIASFSHKRRAADDDEGEGEDEGEEEQISAAGDDSEEYDEDDDEEYDDVALNLMNNENSYALSSDGTKVAILQNSSVVFYTFKNALEEMYGKWLYAPYKRVKLPTANYNDDLKFIGNDKLVVTTATDVHIVALSIPS